MAVGKNTKLCISLSTHPGNTGASIHNRLAHDLGLDYVYVPRKIGPHDLQDAIRGVRVMGIHGCSVSMPFKRDVVRLLDAVVGDAEILGVVNTILRTDDILVGSNTDTFGVSKAFGQYIDQESSATIIGAGATAHSAALALARLGVKRFRLWNRTRHWAWELADFIESLNAGLTTSILSSPYGATGDYLVNASAIGMGQEKFPVDDDVLKTFRAVLDVVNAPGTDLISRSVQLGVPCVPGEVMAVYQSLCQFEVYSFIRLDMEETASEFLGRDP